MSRAQAPGLLRHTITQKVYFRVVQGLIRKLDETIAVGEYRYANINLVPTEAGGACCVSDAVGNVLLTAILVAAPR